MHIGPTMLPGIATGKKGFLGTRHGDVMERQGVSASEGSPKGRPAAFARSCVANVRTSQSTTLLSREWHHQAQQSKSQQLYRIFSFFSTENVSPAHASSENEPRTKTRSVRSISSSGRTSLPSCILSTSTRMLNSVLESNAALAQPPEHARASIRIRISINTAIHSDTVQHSSKAERPEPESNTPSQLQPAHRAHHSTQQHVAAGKSRTAQTPASHPGEIFWKSNISARLQYSKRSQKLVRLTAWACCKGPSSGSWVETKVHRGQERLALRVAIA